MLRCARTGAPPTAAEDTKSSTCSGRQDDVVRHDHVVAHLAVVGHVRCRQEEAAIADLRRRRHPPCRGSWSRLADRPMPPTVRVDSPAYFRSCGWCPTGREGEDLVRAPIVVRPASTTWLTSSQPRPARRRADHAERADDDALAEPRAPGSTMACRMDELTSRLLNDHQHGADLASATSARRPSPRRVNHHMLRRLAQLRHVDTRRLSPGTTGLRNLRLVDRHEEHAAWAAAAAASTTQIAPAVAPCPRSGARPA